MCRLTMDPDNKKIALLKGKYGTVSGTLTAHKSYRIAADPLVAYFLFGIFQGFPTDYMPLNINHPSVLVTSTGVAFCNIELLCVPQ